MQNQSRRVTKPPIPHNIAKRVKEDMTHRDATNYIKSQQIVALNTEWSAKAAAYKPGKIKEREEKMISEELSLANEVLLNLRRAKLQELYMSEMSHWEVELKGMGFAMIAEKEW